MSEITGLPLYILDKIQFQPGGAQVPHEEYKYNHQKILDKGQWIIDGFGCMETLCNRYWEFQSLIGIINSFKIQWI